MKYKNIGNIFIKRQRCPQRISQLSLSELEQKRRIWAILLRLGFYAPICCRVKPNGLFMYSQFVSGEDLESAIAKKKLNTRDLLCLLRTLLKTIAILHERGICHGDIALGNIIFTPDRKFVFIDWENSVFSNTCVSMGSTMYLSPARIRNLKVDVKSEFIAALKVFNDSKRATGCNLNTVCKIWVYYLVAWYAQRLGIRIFKISARKRDFLKLAVFPRTV